MTENGSPYDWDAKRGEKWSRQCSGIEATLAPIDAPLLAALGVDRACGVAEVGSGGGGTALELFRRLPPGSHVHGFDISPTLVKLAQLRAEGVPAVTFSVADAANYVPDQRYERVVSRFGVLFFEDELAAFRNIVQWLVPGGRCAFAVWAPPEQNPWMSVVAETVARVVEVPPPNFDGPGPFRYGNADKLIVLLRHAGLREVEVEVWKGSLPIGGGLSPGDAAVFALEAFSTYRERLGSEDGREFLQARELLTEVFTQHVEDEVVRLGACVQIVSGRVG